MQNQTPTKPPPATQVEGGTQRLVASGPFSVAVSGSGAAAAVEAAVGAARWALSKSLPALKAAPAIYSFGLGHTRSVYYILILPPATPPDVLDALEDVLAGCTALSTARQVDAADAQLDALKGGKGAKEAEALASADGGAGEAAEEAAAATAATTAVATATPASTAATATAATAAGGGGGGAAAAPAPAATMSGRITASVATGLVTGSAAIAEAVRRGADAVNEAVTNYKERQIAAPATAAGAAAGAGTSQQQQQQQHARVHPALKVGIKVAAVAASAAAYTTGKLAAAVGDATYSLALRIAKALPGHPDRPPPPNAAADGGAELRPQEVSGFRTVAAAGLTAYVQVYDALEDAARSVAEHSAAASAHYISYKYGPEAGEAASASVPVARDLMATVANTTRLGARAMISKTAKGAAKIYLAGAQHPEAAAAAAAAAAARRRPQGGGNGNGGGERAAKLAGAPA